MALASAITQNTTLMSARLDGNPIGHEGGRAMLRAQVVRTFVKLAPSID